MIGHNNAIEIGFELIYLRNIEVEKIDFLRVKQPQYLAECHTEVNRIKENPNLISGAISSVTQSSFLSG